MRKKCLNSIKTQKQPSFYQFLSKNAKLPGYDLSLKGDGVAALGQRGYGFLVTWYAS